MGFSVIARAALTFTGYGAYGWLLLPARFDGLAAGALVALLSSRNPDVLDRWAARIVKAGMVLVPSFVVVMAGLFWHNEAPLADTLRTIYRPRRLEIVIEPFIAAIAFASVVAAVSRRRRGSKRLWLESRVLAKVSRYSYGMYMLHVVVILLVFSAGVPAKRPVFGLDLPWQIAFTALIVAGSAVAGFLTWHLWEKWFLKAAPAYTYNRAKAGEGKATVPPADALPLPAP
jgi:peptidoglycan/LPS O-acetylase OafA/YrhL